MNFNTYAFVLAFLPIAVLLFYTLRKLNNKILCFYLSIVSVLFCFFSGTKTVLFLLASIVINYAIYLILVKEHSKIILAIGISVNILALGYFKYYNMFIDVTNMLTGSELHIKELLLPVGISFITFQQIAFLVDVYKEEKNNYSLLEYCTFITFFPHFTSGPIITVKQFMPEIRKDFQHINWSNISDGIYIFAMGLTKKVLLADTLGRVVDSGYENLNVLNGISVWYIVIGYTLQIYFDFSGYSDMAIGIAKLFDIELPINFASPYKAKNILEFWERWHISLTKFFTKYLYIPLGGNRRGKTRTIINTMIVFAVSGLWHGANYTFVIWGILHGICMVLTKLFINPIKRIPNVISGILTFMTVNLLWIFFRAPSLKTAFNVFRGLISSGISLNSIIVVNFNHIMGFDIPDSIAYYVAFLFLIICLAVVFIPKNVYEYLDIRQKNVGHAIYAVVLICICVLSFSDVTTYIYNGF